MNKLFQPKEFNEIILVSFPLTLDMSQFETKNTTLITEYYTDKLKMKTPGRRQCFC